GCALNVLLAGDHAEHIDDACREPAGFHLGHLPHCGLNGGLAAHRSHALHGTRDGGELLADLLRQVVLFERGEMLAIGFGEALLDGPGRSEHGSSGEKVLPGVAHCNLPPTIRFVAAERAEVRTDGSARAASEAEKLL